MKTAQQTRLENKLKLWDTPGFSQFIEDLIDTKGPECDIRREVVVLRRLYMQKLKEIAPQSKYVQLKIEGL